MDMPDTGYTTSLDLGDMSDVLADDGLGTMGMHGTANYTSNHPGDSVAMMLVPADEYQRMECMVKTAESLKDFAIEERDSAIESEALQRARAEDASTQAAAERQRADKLQKERDEALALLATVKAGPAGGAGRGPQTLTKSCNGSRLRATTRQASSAAASATVAAKRELDGVHQPKSNKRPKRGGPGSKSPVDDDKVPGPEPSDVVTAMVCSPDNGASSASFNSSLVSAEVNENATADQPSGLEIQGLSYLPPTGDNIYDNNSIQDTTEIGVIAEDEAMIPLDRLPAKLRKLAHPPEGCYSTGLQLRARGPGSRSGGNRSREVKKPRVKVYIKRGPDGLLLYMDDFTERSKNLAIKINTWVTTHISEDCIKRGPVTHPILDFAEVKFTQDQWADLATHVGNIRGNRTQNKSTLPPVQRDQKYLSQFFNEFLSMPCPDDRTREGSFWPWRSFDAQHYNLQAFRHTTWGMACRGHVNGEAIGRPLIEVCDPIAEDSNAKSKDGITSA